MSATKNTGTAASLCSANIIPPCLIQALLTILLCLLLLPAAPAQAQQLFDPGLDYVPNDPDTCLICHSSNGALAADNIMHGAHGITANPGSPFATGQPGCQTCHGPSAEHLRVTGGIRPPPAMVFDERRPARQQDAVCLTCHERDTGHEWAGSTHQFAEVTCASCHTLHSSIDPAVTFEGQTAICLDCHQRQRAEILHASSHPFRSGQMNCSACHAPHGGSGPVSLIEPSINDQCYQCHAETRGPFLWEHAPVAEDCTNCHTPHGSPHRNLLQARTPFMCQQCHLAAFHPSNLESGMGIPPRGTSSNILGRDCLSCHIQIHGSNHPSGSGLTR